MVLAGVLLIGFRWQLIGWLLWLSGAVIALRAQKEFRWLGLSLYGSVAILALVPITTELSTAHMVYLGVSLIVALMLPQIIDRFIAKTHVLRFHWPIGRWRGIHSSYLFGTIILSWLILPWYLTQTGAFRNWTVELNPDSLIRLFIGTNGLGFWDELFFINTIFPIFRRFFSFWWANIFQAVLFTAFLFELGFTAWGWALIGVFALAQGYVFYKTDSLRYVIILHLSMDAILYLALIEAHYPGTIWLM